MACDACGVTGVPLTKISLSADFFGDSYDRLTPSSDKSPAWYCPTCSKEKSLLVDYRSIAGAWKAQTAGQPSPLADLSARQRCCKRLREIGATLLDAKLPQRLLDVDRVDSLCQEIATA